MKTAEKRGRGYDGGKRVNGRKRHLVVDTSGLALRVQVHAADMADRDGARLVLDRPSRAMGLAPVWWISEYLGVCSREGDPPLVVETALSTRVPPGGGAAGGNKWQSRRAIARELDISIETLRQWVKQAEIDAGIRHSSLTSEEAEEV